MERRDMRYAFVFYKTRFDFFVFLIFTVPAQRTYTVPIALAQRAPNVSALREQAFFVVETNRRRRILRDPSRPLKKTRLQWEW